MVYNIILNQRDKKMPNITEVYTRAQIFVMVFCVGVIIWDVESFMNLVQLGHM